MTSSTLVRNFWESVLKALALHTCWVLELNQYAKLLALNAAGEREAMADWSRRPNLRRSHLGSVNNGGALTCLRTACAPKLVTDVVA